MELGRLVQMEVRSNTVVANYARQWGGGIFVMDSRPRLERNLVAENRCDHRGGGIGCGRAAFPDLRCNLAWNNTPENFFLHEDSTDVPGIGDQIVADPQFCNFVAGNFHPWQDGPANTAPCGLIGALEAGCAEVKKILR